MSIATKKCPSWPGFGPVDHVAELGAVGRAREQAGDHADRHAEADALVLADRLDEARERRGGIGRRLAVGVEGPALGNGAALLVIDADLAVGGGAEGEVEDERRCLAAGMAIDSGLMPTILSIPPHGAMVGSALVPARPIMPAVAAVSVYQSIAPQWLDPRTAASASPTSRAFAIARCMAKAPPIWPIELSPSTTIAAPRSETTLGLPRGSTPSLVSFLT